MWQVVRYPSKQAWAGLLKRPAENASTLYDKVSEVMDAVRREGDIALHRYAKQFDKADPESFMVSESEWKASGNEIPDSLKEAIEVAVKNITAFHEAQRSPVQETETLPGVKCWRKSLPIEKVGLYIPGGSAPLFSTVLMLGIPAKLAGCSRIVLCTPPSAEGKINPAILYAAQRVGVTEIYKLGGIQAIAAMTFGTESVPAVHKIFGPGNQWVMAAKQMATFHGVAIDMPAGPSEVLVMADESCIPSFVASDLLSQAEHGPDSQVILLTSSASVISAVTAELILQLSCLQRKEIAEKALQHCRMILLGSTREMLDMSNEYAPEHLIIAMKDAMTVAGEVRHAGSVFLGNYTPESAGDYASGTNHSLPTSGYARAYSGVSLDSFIKRTTFQCITREGFALLGPSVMEMAGAESLDAHRNAALLRLKH
jgi:histidinol dehydrogenase